MSETIQKLIDRWRLEPRDGSDLTLPCAAFFRGFTMRDYVEVEPQPIVTGKPSTFRYQDHWSTGYREIFVSREERAIFTYCEGDLDLTVDPDDETFERRLASTEAFYREVATK